MQENENFESENLDEDVEYDILTLVDEDEEEHEFELLDSIIQDDVEYLAVVPIFEDPQDFLDDSAELIIMKASAEDQEAMLEIVQEEEEYNRISEIFMERLNDDFDFE